MPIAHGRPLWVYVAAQHRLPHLGFSQHETWAHRSNRHAPGMRPTPTTRGLVGQTMTFPNTTNVDLPSSAKARSRRSCPKPARRPIKRLPLALQGGGALGAFTWGVLDRLLQEDTIVAPPVLSFGGFLGVGEGHHPLPWNALTYDTKLGGYMVDLDKAQLSKAPSHQAGEDPFSDPAYERRIRDYWESIGSTL